MQLKASWRGDGLALIAGAILPFAFAPFAWFPLAVLSPAVLFLSWLDATPKRALWRGALFGVAAFTYGIHWVYISIHDYGHVNVGLALFLTMMLIVVQALFPSAAGFAVRRLLIRARVRTAVPVLVLIMPAAWVLSEWLRGWFLGGFPWLVLGYSQIDGPLAGVAPLLGVYGVSLVVAVTAGLLAYCFIGRNLRSRVAALSVILLMWAASEAGRHLQWTEPSGAPIKVALIQGNIPQDMKWLPAMRQYTVELYADLTRRHWDADVVIWPESAIPAFYSEAADFLDKLAREASATSTELLIGVIYDEPETGRYFNSVLALGQSQGFYHKQHLVPFTEYLPLKTLLSGIVDFMDVPMSDFSAGPKYQSPLTVAGHAAAITICYEDAFGEEMIRQLPRAEFLVNVSNDAWFGESIAPDQHLQIARMRAAEMRRPLLRATNTGITAVITDNGTIRARAKQFVDQVLVDRIQPRKGSTPYVAFGNYPAVTLLFGMLFIGLWRAQSGRGT